MAVMGARPTLRSRAPSGFTIIELLVVVAVVGVLMAVLLPALGHARACAVITGELSTARQFITAHQMYTSDAKDWVMPGYASNTMVRNGKVIVKDAAGQRLVASPIANRYPWRLMPYMDYTIPINYRDAGIIGALPDQDKEYAVSLAPRFGLNQAFVGGSADSDGTGVALADSSTIRQNAVNYFGNRWYVSRSSEVRAPSDLIVFTSSYGSPAMGNVVLDGYFKALPPKFFNRIWKPTNFRDAAEPVDTGFVSFRFSGKTVAAHFDGHAATLTWEECQDMRKWAPRAQTPDWPHP